MKHFGLTLNLKDDPELIEQYKAYHRDAWKETLAGLKAVGITKMKGLLSQSQVFDFGRTLLSYGVIKKRFAFI